MIAPGTIVRRPSVLESVTERRGAAFIADLADICRAWPELAAWLCDDFGRSGKTRENFRALVAAPASPAGLTKEALASVTGTGSALRLEKARVAAEFGPEITRLWGGRTWTEMAQLVRRYEAGTLDLGVFILVRNWRKAGARAKVTPELRRAAMELFDAVIGGQSHLWANVSSALALLKRTNSANLRGTFGHADWWKLHALFYMMSNPRASYRTRDVRAHLAKLGLAVSSLDFRRFCNRHRIHRDMRAGRPRKLR